MIYMLIEASDNIFMKVKLRMDKIIEVLRKLRVNPVNVEYDLQQEIANILKENHIPYSKEYQLGPRNRVDFLAGTGIVIEVKKGKPGKVQVVKQLERYASFDMVSGIVLVVEKNLDIPRKINGKPCVSLGLNKLWGIAL